MHSLEETKLTETRRQMMGALKDLTQKGQARSRNEELTAGNERDKSPSLLEGRAQLQV